MQTLLQSVTIRERFACDILTDSSSVIIMLYANRCSKVTLQVCHVKCDNYVLCESLQICRVANMSRQEVKMSRHKNVTFGSESDLYPPYQWKMTLPVENDPYSGK